MNNLIYYSVQHIGRLFLIGCLLCPTAPVLAADATYLTVEKLLTRLKIDNADQIRDTFNIARRMRYQGEISSVLYEIWEGKKEKYPDLAWQMLEKPIVRLDIANVLLQAARNGKITFDKEPMHKYVSGLIASQDVAVAHIAIWTSEYFDDPRDVPKILSVAKKQQMVTFPISVVTLIGMCNESASHAVEELLSLVTDQERRDYVIKTKQQLDDYRKHDPSYCNK